MKKFKKLSNRIAQLKYEHKHDNYLAEMEGQKPISFARYLIEIFYLNNILPLGCKFKGHKLVNDEIPDLENGPCADIYCERCGIRY